jgi:broad specificity phosphatase PhoE
MTGLSRIDSYRCGFFLPKSREDHNQTGRDPIMAKRLLLARHAETGPDLAGKFIGATDAPLAGHGPEQADRLAVYLTRFNPGICFASPMLRTMQTAQAISEATGLEILADPDLREIDFGSWEGLDFQQIAAADPERVEAWSSQPDGFCFPGGEAVASFQQRVATAAARLNGEQTDTILAVTHGGVIRAMLCHLLGLDRKHYLLFNIRPATITVIDLFDHGGILSGLNLGPEKEG